MRLRSIFTLFLALVLGGAAVLLARAWLERAEPKVVASQQPSISLTKVVVARTTLFFGNRINAEQVRVVDWPADSVPSGVFTSVDDLLKGEEPRTVLRTIEANEPILAGKVSGAGEKATLSAIISEEMRGMTIRVNDVIGVGGFIVPGDRVDVLLTRDEEGGKNKNQITDILLQNIKVLGIDQLANDNQEKPIVVQAVTLEVSPEQAQKLTLASQVGSLTLALRNVLDAQAQIARTVGVPDLRVGEVNDAVAQAQPAKPEKTKVARAPGKAVDPLASVKIFRALNSSEYKVEKERSGEGAPPPQPLEGAAGPSKPAVSAPAAPAAAPTPLMPQPEVSAGIFDKPKAVGAEI